MSVQKQNPEMNDMLAATFPKRSEPNFAMANIVSTYLMLPYLRGFWPMSSMDEVPAIHDLSGQGRTLSVGAGCSLSWAGLMPYMAMTGAGYLSRADEAGLDITGQITFGGWFWFNNLAANMGLLNKDNGALKTSGYWGFMWSGGPQFVVGVGNGAASAEVASSQVPVANTWNFVVGRLIPATQIAICVNGNWNNAAAGGIAAMDNNAGALQIGRVFGASNLVGRAALCFLCAQALSSTIVNNLFETSRPAFGV